MYILSEESQQKMFCVFFNLGFWQLNGLPLPIFCPCNPKNRLACGTTESRAEVYQLAFQFLPVSLVRCPVGLQ